MDPSSDPFGLKSLVDCIFRAIYFSQPTDMSDFIHQYISDLMDFIGFHEEESLERLFVVFQEQWEKKFLDIKDTKTCMESVPSLQNISEAEIEDLLQRLYKDLAMANVLPQEVIHKTGRKRERIQKPDDNECAVDFPAQADDDCTEIDVVSIECVPDEEDDFGRHAEALLDEMPCLSPPLLVTSSNVEVATSPISCDSLSQVSPEPFVAPSPPRQELVLPPSPPRLELVLPPSPPKLELVLPPSPPRQELVLPPSPPRLELVLPPSPPKFELVLPPSPPRLELVLPSSPPRRELVLPPSPPKKEFVLLPSPPNEKLVLPPSPPKKELVLPPSPPKREILSPCPRRQKFVPLPSPPRREIVPPASPTRKVQHDPVITEQSNVMPHMKGSAEGNRRATGQYVLQSEKDKTPGSEKPKCMNRVTLLLPDKTKEESFGPKKTGSDARPKQSEPKSPRISPFSLPQRQRPSKSELVSRSMQDSKKTRLVYGQASGPKKSERSESQSRLTILEAANMVSRVTSAPKRPKLGPTPSLPEVRRTRLSLHRLYGAERPKTAGADTRSKPQPKQPWKNPLSDPPRREGPPRVLWMERERVKPVQNKKHWKLPANLLF
ncbi:proline-rich protein 36-like [Hippocampus comes]|uniref:proline-rich protein 36-like n=1 Tax=Hippocampus comes TaxID=109280 RepID=UPI00094E239A|nr:PREDICTED: proline-rich protein 36-like [Hippocampus comes]